MVDEGIMGEEDEVQGKRVRAQIDQNELNNVQVVVARLEWPQMIQ